MTDPDQRALILPPPATLHTHQPIIRPLLRLYNPMRRPKRRPQRRRSHRTVGKVLHALPIRCLRIKLLYHIPARQLTKRPRLDIHPPQRTIHPRQPLLPNILKALIRKRATAMRARHRGQAAHAHIRRLQPTNHVARVQAAHAVRDDVDALPAGLVLDVGAQFGGAGFDRGGGGHGG